MKRKTTNEEKELFRKHVAEAILKPKLPGKAPPKVAKAKTGVLDGNTVERLRRGQLTPGARRDGSRSILRLFPGSADWR
ncbi:MAG TPA: hypothetical protein VMU31_03610, partial [Rhizomicrobium sp.]|nr:hypothetical protein [Rhizomicrobium sp.]